MSQPDDYSELARLKDGGEAAFADLFAQYEDRLHKVVRFRLDQRLWGRVDPADIIQEAYLETSRRWADYLRDPKVPVFIWLRRMTEQVLINVHRHHLGARRRNAGLEVSLDQRDGTVITSVSLAARLVADLTSPSQAAIRDEMLHQLRQAFDSMDPLDREVLALRHFEELTNNEVAEVLGLQKAAASNRYVRALKRLKQILSSLSPSGSACPDSPEDRTDD
jgi:RNA polymerase sigma-70 factor, ECF subfamily